MRIPKVHVVLDTNIYRKDPTRSDLSFKALERLCKAGIVKLHLPYVVEREFQTQQLAQYTTELKASIAGLNSIIRKGLSPTVLGITQTILDTLNANSALILDDAVSALTNWAVSISAERHPITETQAIAAMESYFQGKLPLKQPKHRDDIPDAFIFQTLIQISATAKPFYVVSEDDKIAQAAATLADVRVFRSLDTFIAAKEIQAEIANLEVIKNIPEMIKLLKQFESEYKGISNLLEVQGCDKLSGKTIYSPSIPDDNNEATITGFDQPENIELDFDNLHYYGYGEFGLPFGFQATVTITYYIFKGDYNLLDEDNLPSVTDHNNHYYEAEDEISVNVTGMMKISFVPEKVISITAETVEDHIAIEIDSIDSIEVS